jgi:AraC-like DNA-binding protein
MNSAVERAIECISERYSEPLSLADVASSAILSRFHFSRVFRDTTGVTPGRFLSAVRIYQAKRMLLNTSLSITDIAFAVGYNSLGSFSNHFTDSVGVSPGRFRRISQHGQFDPPDPRRAPAPATGALEGTITLPRGYAAASVYVGAFDTPIVQRRPASAALVEVSPAGPPAPYYLGCVPAGSWFVHAVAVADSADPEPWTRRALLIGGQGPVVVTVGAATPMPVELRARQRTDLPILLALPELEAQLDTLAPVAAEPVLAGDLVSAPLGR